MSATATVTTAAADRKADRQTVRDRERERERTVWRRLGQDCKWKQVYLGKIAPFFTVPS